MEHPLIQFLDLLCRPLPGSCSSEPATEFVDPQKLTTSTFESKITGEVLFSRVEGHFGIVPSLQWHPNNRELPSRVESAVGTVAFDVQELEQDRKASLSTHFQVDPQEMNFYESVIERNRLAVHESSIGNHSSPNGAYLGESRGHIHPGHKVMKERIQLQAASQSTVDKIVTLPSSSGGARSGEQHQFVCELGCGRSFRRAEHLKRHFGGRRHTKDRPFSCGECGRMFSRNDNLRTHQSKTRGKVQPRLRSATRRRRSDTDVKQ